MGNEKSHIHSELDYDTSDDECASCVALDPSEHGDDELESNDDSTSQVSTTSCASKNSDANKMCPEVLQTLMDELSPAENEKILDCCVQENGQIEKDSDGDFEIELLIDTDTEIDADIKLIDTDMERDVDTQPISMERDAETAPIDKDTKKDADIELMDKDKKKDVDMELMDKDTERDAEKVLVDKDMEREAEKVLVDKDIEREAPAADIEMDDVDNNNNPYLQELQSRFPGVSKALLRSIQSLEIPLKSLIPPPTPQIDSLDSLLKLKRKGEKRAVQKDEDDGPDKQRPHIMKFKGGASIYEVKSVDNALQPVQNLS